MPEADAAQVPTRSGHKLWLHALLFFTTCVTTFYAGGFSGSAEFSPADGVMFMTAIMSILLVHEMGHYTAARRHGVQASLPYFIPVPLPPIGTFGAVIQMHKPPDSRASLLDIGAAGPLAGMVVAVPVCFVGLVLSDVQPMSDLPEGAILEGNSLLYLLLKWLAHPEMGPNDGVFLHPLAWAGWIGLLVTSLNMLPAGQLDGGHIVYAMTGKERHIRFGAWVRWFVLSLGLAGLACQLVLLSEPTFRVVEEYGLEVLVLRGSGMVGWLVWAVLLRFVGTHHPPVDDAHLPLGPGRRRAGWLALIILALTFTPVFLSPVSA